MPRVPCFFASGAPPSAGKLVVGEGLFAGLGNRDQGAAADSKVTVTAADDEALNLTAGSVRLDQEIAP